MQVKVLRDPTKKDSKGNPQGKGIAFAEFSDPEHALCALRQLNNNPAPFGKRLLLVVTTFAKSVSGRAVHLREYQYGILGISQQ